MARHKARSRRTTAVIAAFLMACATVLVSFVGTGNAGAITTTTTPGKKVIMKDSVVTAQCGFTLESVNTFSGQAQVRIGAQAQPTSVFGYTTNAFTAVACFVFDPAGNTLALFAPNTNHPVLFNTSENVAIPYENTYTFCGYAFVKLSNGNSDYTNFVCTS